MMWHCPGILMTWLDTPSSLIGRNSHSSSSTKFTASRMNTFNPDGTLRHLRRARIVACLGFSATPFQLRHDELLSLLKLRRVLSLSKVRFNELDDAVSQLGLTMKTAHETGEGRRRSGCGFDFGVFSGLAGPAVFDQSQTPAG